MTAHSPLRVFIADDEPLALDRLTALIQEQPGVEIAGVARHGAAALEAIVQLQPDVVLLDVRMPGQSGMSVARALGRSPRTQVIFVTAHPQFAVEAFEVNAADYLLKPVDPARLSTALNRARRIGGTPHSSAHVAKGHEATPRRFEDVLWVPRGDTLRKVAVSSLIWIEAARDYALLHARQGSFMLLATMSELEQRLDPAAMWRVSRSAFVAPSAITEVVRDGRSAAELLLTDGARIRVGSTYRRRVTEALRFPSRNGMDHAIGHED
jgi:two-component system LytT family response regulator